MKTHAEHQTTVTIGRTQGFLLCLDCRAIVEDLPLCGAMTKRGGSCRWAILPGSDTAEHPHMNTAEPAKTRPQIIKSKSAQRAIMSPSEARWLANLIATNGRADQQEIALTGIKRGQAEMLVHRYGGSAEGVEYSAWQWRCEGRDAERIAAALASA